MSLSELNVVIPSAEAVAIEYPGFVRNVNKALNTLGGIDGIQAAVSSKQQYLKLKHRPGDPTSHPLYGERSEHARLLLRISRPKQPTTGNTTAPTTATANVDPATTSSCPDVSDVSATVVSRVSHTFRFPGLADYAYVPYDPLLPSRSRDLLPYDQRPDKSEPSRVAQPLLVVPQLFSWLDLPQDYGFRQMQFKHSARGGSRPEPNWGDAPVISFYAEGVPPPATAATRTAPGRERSPAGEGAPEAGEGGGRAAGTGCPTDTPSSAYPVLEAAVGRLLAVRPVWVLDLIRERCGRCPEVVAALGGSCDAGAVEKVVQRLCYRFKTGPWRGLFIRRGYDPRTDPGARQYQAIVYSLPNNWYRSMLRTAFGAGGGQRGPQPPQGSGVQAAGAEGTSGGGAPPPSGPPTILAPTSLEDLHNFRALPTCSVTTLQLLDLQLPEVQQRLQERPSAAESVRCSEKTGWFSNTALQAMQNAVQQRFAALMERIAPPGTTATAKSTKGTTGGPTAATRRTETALGVRSGAAATAARGSRSAAGDANGGGADVSGTGTGAGGRVGVIGGGGGDVEMAEVAGSSGTALEGTTPAAAGRPAAAANEAFRVLMAQMNLRGVGRLGASGGGGEGVDDLAGLFGSEDDEDEFQLLDGEGGVDGGREAGGKGGEGRGGRGVGAAAGGRAGRGGSNVGGGVGGGDDGGELEGEEEEGVGGEVSEGEESALESEYEVALGDDEDEDEEGEGEGAGGGGRLAVGSGNRVYGRVVVPYDGGYEGGGADNMFGSDDDDEPY